MTNGSALMLPNAQEVKDIFRPREDAYAVWHGSNPVPAKDNNGQLITLPLSAIEAHLNGKSLIGFYSTRLDDTCTFGVIDFDRCPTVEQDVQAVYSALRVAGFPALIERSKSTEGFHIWILFDGSIPAYKVRLVLLDIVRSSGIATTGALKKERSFDRIFPTQDSVHGKFGNLIAMPFYGGAVLKGGSLFVDPESFVPCEDQRSSLLSAPRVSGRYFDSYIEEHGLEQKSKLRARQVSGSLPVKTSSRLGDMAYLNHCEFIKFADREQATLSEPLWFVLADNLSAFGEEARDMFHSLSTGYAGYSREETDRKFNESVSRRQSNLSPVGCHRLADDGFECPKLNTCPARMVANFPSAFPQIPMSQQGMQEASHTIAEDKVSDVRLQRFALGYRQLSSDEQSAILEEVANAAGWGTDKQKRNAFIKRLMSAGTSIPMPIGVRVRDIWKDAPGSEHLVIPQGYDFTKDGKVVRVVMTPDGPEQSVVSDVPLIMVEVGQDFDRSLDATRTLAFQHVSGGWEQVQVSREQSSDGRSIHRALGRTSFIMSSDQGPEIAKYLKAFELDNRKWLVPKDTFANLGWVESDDGWEYVPYSTRVTFVPRGAGDRRLAHPRTFESHGMDAEWLRVFDMVKDFPIARFLLVAALTPPVFPLLDDESQSHSVAICGEPGTGKSLMQKVGATAFGRSRALLRSWNATSVGVEQALAIRRYMPAMYEDFQNATDKDVNTIVYLVFNETGRERGAKEGGTRTTAEFKTIMIASAESDIRHKAMFSGFLRRSLVLTQPVFGGLNKQAIKRLATQLWKVSNSNRGSFGRAWISRIGEAMRDEDLLDQIQRRYSDAMRRLEDMKDQLAYSAVDVTLCRLMAQHYVTAMLLEHWFDIPELEQALDVTWTSILESAEEADLSKRYMRSALEWASRNEDVGFREVVGNHERYGIMREDYVAFYPDALESKLREIYKNPTLSLDSMEAEWARRGWIQTSGTRTRVDVKARKDENGQWRNEKMLKVLFNAPGLPLVREYIPPIRKVQDGSIEIARIPDDIKDQFPALS